MESKQQENDKRFSGRLHFNEQPQEMMGHES